MTHNELLAILIDKMPKMNSFDVDILKDIVAGVALKDNSIYDFYRELTTSGNFLDMALIERIAKNYTVPSMYREHIENRFDSFKNNIKTVCLKNKIAVDTGKKPGYKAERWVKDSKPMFSSTERMTIDKAGGLQIMCRNIMKVGQFDFLKSLFEESATDVSKVKYALMMQSSVKQLGGSNGK